MSSTDLEILNLKRQVEIQNQILREILEEMKNRDKKYEEMNEHLSTIAFGVDGYYRSKYTV